MINQIIGRNGAICLLVIVLMWQETAAKFFDATNWTNEDYERMRQSIRNNDTFDDLNDYVNNHHRKVSNGYYAHADDYPSFVTVKVVFPDPPVLACGGVILTTRTILTSAACLNHNNIRGVWIHTGTQGVNDWEEDKVYVSDKLCVPNEYKTSPVVVHNYGLVRLLKHITLGQKYVKKVMIPSRMLVATDQAYLVSAGRSGKDEEYRKNAFALPLKWKDCEVQNLHESHICFEASHITYPGEPCDGDQGSPVYAMLDGRLEIFAMVSYGYDGCRKEGSQMATYTNVYHHWNDIINLNNICVRD